MKRYGDSKVVDDIHFEVRTGEVFSLLGPNGAGKSTTMRMLSGTSTPSGGSLRILGMNPVKDGPAIRARLGVVPQKDNLDRELTVLENLTTYARLFGLSRKAARERSVELLEFVQLTDRAKDLIDSLSGGMTRRLTIARALVNKPDVILLDEPTTGLDPQARHLLWDRLRELKRNGVTVVLTTHYMDEAEQLSDRITIVDRGRIVASGTPAQLLRTHGTPEVVELRHDDGCDPSQLPALRSLAERVEVLGSRVLLYVRSAEETVAAVHRAGLRPSGTLERRCTLEDVFLRLTGRSLVE
ncbi:ABC transporter ATP-binding protein [Streptomyces phaeoluteigriseus]|uniref:ABC transporter ATP-binding protein n=1 Tax=Streptomyces phaeoluteigriseus TaxID=114686 RepID=A0ABY4Z4H5_9ACTN|nr:ABC transporter ATP-binding protein [Streptomyces phaeoluteigriseus]USQ83580.1 ABC transporter ATP-binding protein [Streptomyces phaeoluteigriseus]